MGGTGKTAATFVVIALVASNAPRAARQAESAANAAFEAASIKPSAETRDAEPASMVMPGGRYVATNVTLRRLVRTAYALQDAQVVGGPSWMDDDRFDALATANRACRHIREQFVRCSRRCFASGSQSHNDMRSCRRMRWSSRDAMEGSPRLHQSAGVRHEPRAAPSRRAGARAAEGSSMRRLVFATGSPRGTRVELGRFVETLAPLVERVVVDRTNLGGSLGLKCCPRRERMPGTTSRRRSSPLVEQLGLKLDSRKLPVDVMIVDRAEHLTEN
jgi:hypothetical protein